MLDDKISYEKNQENLQTRLSLLATNHSILRDNLTRIINKVDLLSSQVCIVHLSYSFHIIEIIKSFASLEINIWCG